MQRMRFLIRRLNWKLHRELLDLGSLPAFDCVGRFVRNGIVFVGRSASLASALALTYS